MEGVLGIEEFARLFGRRDGVVPVEVAWLRELQGIKDAAEVRKIAKAAPGPLATWQGWSF